MTPKKTDNTFCEYTFTAENVKLYIVNGYHPLYYPAAEATDNDILHSHRWYELFFLEEGFIHCFFQEETCCIQAGELFVIKPGTLHYTDTWLSGGKIMVVNFFFEILNQTDTAPWLPLFTFDRYTILPFDQECRALTAFFFQALKNKQGLLAGSYLFAFLTRLACLQLPDQQKASVPDTDSNVGRIYKIDQILQRYYKENPSLSDISRELHLSERQLSRIIEKHYGCSYREQITTLRMQEAAALLAKGISVNETAHQVGYVSVRAFHNAFVKYFGTSPGSYHK